MTTESADGRERRPLPDSWWWTGDPERGLYIRAVWDAFVAKRGTEWPEMSSAEWDMVANWKHEEIPLRIVLRALQDMRRPNRRMTLLYARPAVEATVRYWRKAVS